MTDHEIEYLKNNYSSSGPIKCAKFLNKSYNYIRNYSNKILKLKVNKNFWNDYRKEHTKHPLKIDIDNILSIKEICYILGYIYADGHLPKNVNNVVLTLQKEDMIAIKSYLEKMANWLYYDTVSMEPTRKPKIIAVLTNIEFRKFLEKYNFLDKSSISPIDLYNVIPDDNKHLFLRGYLDGDGCIYISKNNKCCISFAGTENNDWVIMQEIFKKLNIKKHIYKWKTPKQTWSIFKTSKKSDIITLGNYIYKDYVTDNIGLSRKYNKFLEIKKSMNINEDKF